MDFSLRLQNLRDEFEPPINQTEFGALLNMSQRKISAMERGVTEPNLQDIFDICTRFNISADYMLGLIDEPLPYRRTK